MILSFDILRNIYLVWSFCTNDIYHSILTDKKRKDVLWWVLLQSLSNLIDYRIICDCSKNACQNGIINISKISFRRRKVYEEDSAMSSKNTESCILEIKLKVAIESKSSSKNSSVTIMVSQKDVTLLFHFKRSSSPHWIVKSLLFLTNL